METRTFTMAEIQHALLISHMIIDIWVDAYDSTVTVTYDPERSFRVRQ